MSENNNAEVTVDDPLELNEDFFRRAKLAGPLIQKYTALVDRDVYEWFKSEGGDYMQRMNHLLRTHMEEQLASRTGCGK